MMNRADYESLASAVHEAEVPIEHAQTMALEIATALCATNDRFDPKRFIEQVDLGITEQDVKDFSHALFLRTQTGVGATRREIQRTR
jgi:hypothetical protein